MITTTRSFQQKRILDQVEEAIDSLYTLAPDEGEATMLCVEIQADLSTFEKLRREDVTPEPVNLQEQALSLTKKLLEHLRTVGDIAKDPHALKICELIDEIIGDLCIMNKDILRSHQCKAEELLSSLKH